MKYTSASSLLVAAAATGSVSARIGSDVVAATGSQGVRRLPIDGDGNLFVSYHETRYGLPSEGFSGNPNCQDLGYNYGWKMEGCKARPTAIPFADLEKTGSGIICPADTYMQGKFDLECSDDGVLATITALDAGASVFMKGGNGGTAYKLEKGVAATIDVGVNKQISHIEFCFNCPEDEVERNSVAIGGTEAFSCPAGQESWVDHEAADSVGEISMKVDIANDKSHFDLWVTKGPYGPFDDNRGVRIPAYCVDYSRGIGANTYLFDVFSAFDEDIIKDYGEGSKASSAVDFPEYLPNLGWLMNNINIGDTYDDGSCSGVIDWNEYQVALWYVIDGVVVGDAIHSYYNQNNRQDCISQGLAKMAMEDGGGWTPDCDKPGELIPLLFIRDDNSGVIRNQVLMGEAKLTDVKGLCKCKAAPTAAPTDAPTAAPTDAPTVKPTDAPTAAPTGAPTAAPTDAPTPPPVTGNPAPPKETTPPTDPPASVCLPTLDFDTRGDGTPAKAGDLAADLFEGVKISTMNNVKKPAMLFDTANPTGGDEDLATDTEGMVLIISEDADQSDPDDNVGGTITFDFAVPVMLHSLGMLDNEEGGGSCTIYDAAGDVIGTYPLPTMKDGEMKRVPVGEEGIMKMVVKMTGSGAITDVEYCADPPTDPPTDPPAPDVRDGPDSDDETKPPGVKGDPHFKTFGGELYDFHGECDMVLLHNPQFKEGLGMDIHLRTKIEDFWSSVVTAAVKIGESTIEISTEYDDQWLWINGQLIEGLQEKEWYTTNVEGFVVRYKESSSTVREVNIYFKGASEKLTMKTYKSFVRVEVDHKGSKDYDGALGLLGSYSEGGARFGRDGKTLIQDPHKFGQEWQVLESEPQIFHTYEGAVVGETCRMPPTFTDEAAQEMKLRRRLVGSGMTEEDAERACSHLRDPEEVKACVFDVIATQDLDMAGAW